MTFLLLALILLLLVHRHTKKVVCILDHAIKALSILARWTRMCSHKNPITLQFWENRQISSKTWKIVKNFSFFWKNRHFSAFMNLGLYIPMYLYLLNSTLVLMKLRNPQVFTKSSINALNMYCEFEHIMFEGPSAATAYRKNCLL